MNRLPVLLAPALLLSLSCGSQQPPVEPPPDPAALQAAALATITQDDLKRHVAYLASNELAGRETLQPGAKLAAQYIAKQFESFGLEPLPGAATYQVPYTLEQYGYDIKDTSATIIGSNYKSTFELGRDVTPFGFSDEGTAEGELVFAGYGITAPKANWDDYEDLDVKGKIVVVLRYYPNEKAEDNPLSKGNHSFFVTKALNAQKHGAVGMLLVTGPLYHKDEDDLRLPERLSLPLTAEEKKMREAAIARRNAMRKKVPGGDNKLLAFRMSQSMAQSLMPTGQALAEWQKKLDAGEVKARDVKLAEAKAKLAVTERKEPNKVQPTNVVGFLRGSDPVLSEQYVVVGGHYDHLGGHAGEGDQIYNGADDNASGTSAVIELAQAFASLPVKPKRSMVFVGWSGEEKGLLGSYAMVREDQLPLSKVEFVLNLDMIGRNPDKPVEVFGDGYATKVRQVTETANADLELPIEFSGLNYAGNSDHHPFFKRDVPVMFFFTGLHKDYHRKTDHPELLSYDRMETITKLSYKVLAELANADESPRFIHQILWLGAEVQVLEQAGANKAVVTAVTADSRGAKAGLIKGDVIVAFGDDKLVDAAAVGQKFRDLSPGQKIALGLDRRGSAVSIQIERAERGYLGVFPGAPTEDERTKHALHDNEGVKIGQVVDGSPAMKSGIKKGDILIRIAGIPVGTRTLGRTLARIGAGEKVAIVVIRGDKRIDLTMVLGKRPKRPGRP